MAVDISPFSESTLALYREIAHTTDIMLAAAREHDWSRVLQLGERYCDEVRRLREQAHIPQPEGDARNLKHDLLVHILANDAAMRDLAMPELARISGLLGKMRRQRSLQATYGATGRAVGA